MNQDTILLKHLTVGYRGKTKMKPVATDLNATLHKGQLTCLLGANGVGKSTLIRTLAGFQPRLGGEILVEGRELADYSERELSRVIGVVLTEQLDMANMTVEEIVAMGRAPYTGFWGRLHQDDRDRVEEALRLVGIAPLSHRMLQTLSDGERQKMMIAKALAQQTPVILLDEPTAFLDFPSRVEVMQLLHRISRETDKTIFLSTHDLDLALQIADCIWLMDQNNGLRIGSPEDLALDGALDGFFARKGIVFDPATGLFRVANEVHRGIRIVGRHGARFAMVRKALLRKGLLGGKTEQSQDWIEIIPDGFVYHGMGKNTKVATVEELLALLPDER